MYSTFYSMNNNRRGNKEPESNKKSIEKQAKWRKKYISKKKQQQTWQNKNFKTEAFWNLCFYKKQNFLIVFPRYFES